MSPYKGTNDIGGRIIMYTTLWIFKLCIKEKVFQTLHRTYVGKDTWSRYSVPALLINHNM